MDFVKKHYEKILLSVVLLGLVGALVFLPFMIANDQQQQTNMSHLVLNPKVAPLPPLDLSLQSNAFARLKSPYKLDFSTTNKLFNPGTWRKKPDGGLIRVAAGDEVGLAVVTKITPLYLILTLESIETNALVTNALTARYSVSVERQAAAVPGQRGKRPHYASLGEKIDAFKILEVRGSLDNPAQLQLVVQLTDTGERVMLSKDKPFRRVDGYSADLRYDLEKPPRTWQGQRLNAVLKFAGDDYIIVAISQDAVILSARSNQKKTTLTYSP